MWILPWERHCFTDGVNVVVEDSRFSRCAGEGMLDFNTDGSLDSEASGFFLDLAMMDHIQGSRVSALWVFESKS